MTTHLKKYLFLLLPFIFLKPATAQDYLVDFTFLRTYTVGELFLLFGVPVENSVDLYKVRYKTPGINMENDTASGLMVIPKLGDTVALPIVVYGHGTTSGRNDVPSQLKGGYEVAMAYGAFGFITLAPDYLGLGDSRGFHPYVHAATEASASLDLLNAGLEYLDVHDPDWDPYFLFTSGYSQGGQSSMALHKEIEDFWSFVYPITAATHMSGPYDMSGVMRDRLLSDVPYGTPSYLAFVTLGYDQIYDLYTDLGEVFKEPYVGTIDSFYNGIINLTVLNNRLLAYLTAGGGAAIPKRMLQDTLVEGIIANPDHRFNVALRDNDRYEWVPAAPTRLYYCGLDEQVPIENAIKTAEVMQGLGAQDVQAINLGPNLNHGGCVLPALTSSIAFFKSFVNASGIEDLDRKGGELRFFPNPTNDIVSIDWAPARNGFEYEVFNSNGIVVDRGLTTSSHLSVSKLPGGLYMILCTAGGETKMGRVLRK